MSKIPKIKIGRNAQRNRFLHSCTNSTTTNFGFCQPTFCREYIPNSRIEFGVKSIVQASPLVFPTFGQMSLRHYLAYVPYSSIWSPFSAFYAGQSYRYANGVSEVPEHTPRINLYHSFHNMLLQTYEFDATTIEDAKIWSTTISNIEYILITDPISRYLVTPIFDTPYTTQNSFLSYVNLHFSELFNLVGVKDPLVSWVLKYRELVEIIGTSDSRPVFPVLSNDGSLHFLFLQTNNVPEGEYPYSIGELKVSVPQDYYEHFTSLFTDFNINHGVFFDNYDLSRRYSFHVGKSFKDFRKVLVGLGFQFPLLDSNGRQYIPTSGISLNEYEIEVFKLFAFYKTWFNLFYPQRDINFSNTDCYRLIKYFSESGYYSLPSPNPSDGLLNQSLYKFLDDISHCFYYKSPDYFSSSILNPNQSGDGHQLTTYFNTDNISESAYVDDFGSVSFDISAKSLQIANRLLRFINKNTVIGRSISNWYKSTFGNVDNHDIIHNEVNIIGALRDSIDVGTVVNQSEGGIGVDGTPFGNYLGAYAGRAVGFSKENKTFIIEGQDYGCLICITTVIPETDYYQGILRENLPCNDRFGKFIPDFDALGYQQLGFIELNGKLDDTRVFGLVPRYQHLKVPHSIVNGDLSDVSTKDSMLAYTLNRDLSEEFDVLSNTPDFRKIGDTLANDGNYNRIFRYVRNDQDHFILHMNFDVRFTAEAKAISESYDTDENANKVLEFNHE